jgi:hypothetical protein
MMEVVNVMNQPKFQCRCPYIACVAVLLDTQGLLCAVYKCRLVSNVCSKRYSICAGKSECGLNMKDGIVMARLLVNLHLQTVLHVDYFLFFFEGLGVGTSSSGRLGALLSQCDCCFKLSYTTPAIDKLLSPFFPW